MDKTEKAFLKQPKVFVCSNVKRKEKRPGKGGYSFCKSVGLGFNPMEATEGTDSGTCLSDKMNRIIIDRRNYLQFIEKYQRNEKKH